MSTVASSPTPTPTPAAASDTAQVALLGNPNTGKSTLFNRLTGIRQRTGNYPGVTVEKRTGTLRLDDRSVDVVDLPGAYSLAAASADERIVVDVLSGHAGVGSRPDVAVCVVDATNLMRHLFLASQVAATGVPMVIALNMADAAREQGLAIDVKLLRQRLGVPVVSTVASRGQGIDNLREAIAEALQTQPHMARPQWPEAVTNAVAYLRDSLPPAVAGSLTEAELQRMLFDHDSAVADRIAWAPSQRNHHIDRARQMLREAGLEPCACEPMVRYAHAAQLLDGVIERVTERQATGTESIDQLLTHRVWGVVVFAATMFAVFWAIYTGAGPLMDGIDAGFGALGEVLAGPLANMPMVQSLVVDGVIAGVGGVVIFLPQILILFFFIALLEDTGYMARAAYLMDRLFAWCGLSGKSFVPLLSGYACAIPGIMGARTIDNPRSRLTTILITPLMSCSARLPVYVLLIGAFIEPRYGAALAAAVLFGMHVLGLAVAMPIAFLFNRVLFKTRRTPFVMEMPPYRVPRLKDVAWRMWSRGKDFLTHAGTIIFAASIVIWALSYFPRPAEVEQQAAATYAQQVAAERAIAPDAAAELIAGSETMSARLEQRVESDYLEQSYLGRAGKAVQPVFAPAGFDWKITVGVLGSFPAREVIIATLGIVYNVGGDVDEEDPSLVTSMQTARWPSGQPVFTVPVALAIMVFFALCLQCMATIAVIGREAGWTWAGVSFAYMTALAWVGAVITYQLGNAIGGMV